MNSEQDPAALAVLENIQARRTIPYKRVRPDALDPDHLEQVLEAANWAPSHRHTEPWRFAVFRGEGRARLGRLLADTYREWAGDDFLQRKVDKAIDRCNHVPVAMAILMRPKRVNPEFEEILAVGCAIQNLHLAAHALGIGCSWSTPAYLDHPNIRAFFDLAETDRCLGFYYMGYMDQEAPDSKRGDLADKITWFDN